MKYVRIPKTRFTELFGKTTKTYVLELFLKNPDTMMSAQTISEEIGASRTLVNEIIIFYNNDKGLLVKERRYGSNYYGLKRNALTKALIEAYDQLNKKTRW